MTETMSIEEYRALEDEPTFTRRVIDYAHERGWLVRFVGPLKSEKGWRTPERADIGFPDLTLARKGRVVFMELKSKTGSLRPEQEAWRDAITGTHIPAGLAWLNIHQQVPVEYYCFRPGDWALVKRVLQ